VNDFQRGAAETAGSIAEDLGFSPTRLSLARRAIVPSQAVVPGEIYRGPLLAEFLGGLAGSHGRSPLEFSHDFLPSNFERQRVLVREEGDIVDTVEPMRLVFSVEPVSARADVTTTTFTSQPSVSFEVPPEVFIEEVTVDEVTSGLSLGQPSFPDVLDPSGSVPTLEVPVENATPYDLDVRVSTPFGDWTDTAPANGSVTPDFGDGMSWQQAPIDPGDPIDVSLSIPTTDGEDIGLDSATVDPETAQPDISIAGVDFPVTPPSPGQGFPLGVRLRNAGGAGTPVEVALLRPSGPAKTVDVPANSERTVRFNGVQLPDLTDPSVEVAAGPAGAARSSEVFSPNWSEGAETDFPNEYRIAGVDFPSELPNPGDPLQFSVVVENAADPAPASVPDVVVPEPPEINVQALGQRRGPVTVPRGESREIQFEYTPSSPGSIEVPVSITAVGGGTLDELTESIAIEQAPTGDGDEDGPPGPSPPTQPPLQGLPDLGPGIPSPPEVPGGGNVPIGPIFSGGGDGGGGGGGGPPSPGDTSPPGIGLPSGLEERLSGIDLGDLPAPGEQPDVPDAPDVPDPEVPTGPPDVPDGEIPGQGDFDTPAGPGVDYEALLEFQGQVTAPLDQDVQGHNVTLLYNGVPFARAGPTDAIGTYYVQMRLEDAPFPPEGTHPVTVRVNGNPATDTTFMVDTDDRKTEERLPLPASLPGRETRGFTTVELQPPRIETGVDVPLNPDGPPGAPDEPEIPDPGDAVFEIPEFGVPDNPPVGEPFPVDLVVENVGEAAGEVTATGPGLDRETTIQPGERETFSPEPSVASPSGRSLRYTIENAGTGEQQSVTQNVTPALPEFAITSIGAPGVTEPGEPFGVDLTVENVGEAAGEFEATVGDQTTTGSLGPGDTTTVGLTPSAVNDGPTSLPVSVTNTVTGNVDDQQTTTVTPAEPALQLSALDAPSSLPAFGGEGTVSATIQNAGSGTGEYVATLGDQERTGSLSPGGSTAVSFPASLQASNPTSFAFSLQEAGTGAQVANRSFTIEPATPSFAIQAVDTPDTVQPGRKTGVNVVVENTGDAPGEATVTFGDQQRSVTVPAGESRSVGFDVDQSGAPVDVRNASVAWAATGETTDSRSARLEAADPDLTLVSTDAPDVVARGQRYTLTAEVTNDGNAPAPTVVGAGPETQTIRIEPGSTRNVRFQLTKGPQQVETVPVAVEVQGQPLTETTRTVTVRAEQERRQQPQPPGQPAQPPSPTPPRRGAGDGESDVPPFVENFFEAIDALLGRDE
jgi:hypothetical protein